MPTADDDQQQTSARRTVQLRIASEVSENGFATAPLLTPESITELLELHHTLDWVEHHGFFASSNDLDSNAASQIGVRITAIVAPSLRRLLPDHEAFLASFLTKGHSRGSEVSFHQDLTYTDERHHRPVMVWVPLCDVDARNGSMAVVPRSHRWTSGVRPGGHSPLPTEPHQDRIGRLSQVVALKAGEALFYDPALMHGSGANPTMADRPAIGIALAPSGADLVHVHCADDATLSAWTVDRDFYAHQDLRGRPEGYASRAIWDAPVDASVIGAALDRAEREPAARSSAQAVLADRSADQALVDDGFVVIDLPEAVEVAEQLSRFYDAAHGPDGDGFEPDLVNPDRAYRRRVSDRIATAFDAAVTDRFVDHEPFLRVYLAKWPGPQSDLYLHRDWMYVDERNSGHTYVVWIPLCDVDETNGPLQVLRHSHLIDDSVRGTNLNAPWINHHDVVIPRLETVSARLGQAVVMDNALVHSSLPNRSGQLRLVAAVGMKPAGAALVHFLRSDDHHAWRYDVDESFLMTITPQELMLGPPDLPVKEQLPAGQRFWSEDELLAAIGADHPTSPRAVIGRPGVPSRLWHSARRLVGRW